MDKYSPSWFKSEIIYKYFYKQEIRNFFVCSLEKITHAITADAASDSKRSSARMNAWLTKNFELFCRAWNFHYKKYNFFVQKVIIGQLSEGEVGRQQRPGESLDCRCHGGRYSVLTLIEPMLSMAMSCSAEVL